MLDQMDVQRHVVVIDCIYRNGHSLTQMMNNISFGPNCVYHEYSHLGLAIAVAVVVALSVGVCL